MATDTSSAYVVVWLLKDIVGRIGQLCWLDRALAGCHARMRFTVQLSRRYSVTAVRGVARALMRTRLSQTPRCDHLH
jgi:hypothetical protein